MQVQFIDFYPQYETVQSEIEKGLKEVFRKGDFILGEEAEQFENEFAAYCGVKYGIGVNSGTDALYLALGALDIGTGDEVILPTHTFIATALCISYTGAKPVFVDIEESTYNIDPKAIAKAITPKTKAILPVHIYGQAANMAEINALAQKNGIKVVEDACQSHGACYQKKRTGSLGDVACFSFYPTKSLGACGDAGIIVTNDPKVNEAARMLRDYGRTGRYSHKVKGFNSRLDTIQAVILSAKLKHLDEWNAMRNAKAQRYAQGLKGIPGLVIPTIQPDRTHVFQTYAIRIKNRDRVIEELKKRGVTALIHYPIPLHLQEAYQDAGHSKGDFPVAERVADDILSLPMFPHMADGQVDYVCQSLRELASG